MPTILVTIEQQLLRSAVMTLLQAEQNLEAISCPFQSSAELLATIRQLEPDLIIVDQRCIEMETIQQVLCSSPNCQQINLVEVNPNSNSVIMYAKRVVQIQQTADLMSIITALCQLGSD